MDLRHESTIHLKDFITIEVKATGLNSLGPLGLGFLGKGIIVDILKQACTGYVCCEMLMISINTEERADGKVQSIITQWSDEINPSWYSPWC